MKNAVKHDKSEMDESASRVSLFDELYVTELGIDYERQAIDAGYRFIAGVDERVTQASVTDEISIGDYVLSGGEPAAAVVVDSIVRLLPGALGSDTSAENDSFSDGLLDCPHYTRPAEFRGMKVPEVLLNGNHAEIEKWRHEKALEKTKAVRKDLLTGENGDM